MGPCQVGCRVFILLHPPIFTMERLVGGVYNEQSMSLSHAWSLFSQSRAESSIVTAKWSSWLGLTSLERCRNVLQGFPCDCLSEHSRDRGDVRKDLKGGTWTWVCIPASLFACLPLSPSCRQRGAAVSCSANHRAVPPCWRTYSLSESPVCCVICCRQQSSWGFFESRGH